MAHPFEPELSRAVPRAVEKRPGHRGLLAWPLPFVMPHTLPGALRPAARGPGGLEEGIPGRGRQCWLTYSYEAGLERIEAKMQVRDEDYPGARPGDAVTVPVNPEHPRRSVLYAYAPWRALG